MGSCKFSFFNSLFLIIMVFYVVSGDYTPQITKDKAALLAFKDGIFSDPSNVLQSWNSSENEVCKWVGIQCNEIGDRVIELVLNYSLGGTISPSLSNISYLEVLDLSQNFFHGQIPLEIGSLSLLRQLSLSENLLEGNIPIQLGSLLNLDYLDLGDNNLNGEIPLPLLCNSSLLKYLDLSNNSLSGEIPIYNDCDLSELQYLLLWSNHLVGELPIALSNSSKLQWLDLELNSLNGELSYNIFSRLPDLQYLYLSYNNFASNYGNTDLNPFFTSLINASNLQELDLAGNQFGGVLPPSIGDLTQNLVQINLGDNHIYGPIPPEISNLYNLTLLNLSSNFFNGSIPAAALSKLVKLERLYLSNNALSGNIPAEFGTLLHLGLIDLSRNKLSGTIPDSFSNLSQLRKLLLFDNRLSGPIPPSLGKCISLDVIDLSNNNISGQIPSEVAGLTTLKLYLNLSCNHLEGPIPLELSKMDMVLSIDLSYNHLSGPIPTQLGNCIALEYLNLSNNALQGNLPSSIGRLPFLKGLDLSLNKLSGNIPLSFQESTSLIKFNFSYNKFSGNVTKAGAYAFTMNSSAFLGNSGLCGPFKGMPHCQNIKHLRLLAMLISMITIFLLVILISFGYHPVSHKLRQLFINNKREIIEKFDDVESKTNDQQNYPRITYRQLIEATNGFSPSNLIGSGHYGRVYKGILPDNTKIAVKVLNDPKSSTEHDHAEYLSGSFERECEVLKRTRHRNLIRIITICSNHDFKAIVLPLMTRGSLEDNLYPNHGLGLVQLVNICSDVAEGIAYLHHYAPVKVAHCDLKPSNILLDDDMTALVTDFGISRLMEFGGSSTDQTNDSSFNDDSVSYTSTDGLLRGSIGYIAPEYGMGKKASIEGDVFSYGVLLLEMITGRRPTDVLIEDGSSFHEWIKSYYPHKLEQIIDEAMARSCTKTSNDCLQVEDVDVDMIKTRRHVIKELIELGLICTQHKPSTRPTMMDVAHDIARLKDSLSSSSTSSSSSFIEEEQEPSRR